MIFWMAAACSLKSNDDLIISERYHDSDNQDSRLKDNAFSTLKQTVQNEDVYFLIFETALELSEKLGLMVDFHSFDDDRHNYGPFDYRTMETLNILDEYVSKLANAWDGLILVVYDHGMHASDENVSYQDMFVPYITTP